MSSFSTNDIGSSLSTSDLGLTSPHRRLQRLLNFTSPKLTRFVSKSLPPPLPLIIPSHSPPLLLLSPPLHLQTLKSEVPQESRYNLRKGVFGL
ncbi:unnamed protein product [Lactuca virosa]|uniref:Uncharacterized protein n=1 Tax=Lactuca virosa TaxID=75947 RepID=A0AAU9MKF9_9ASTR|nr:unnamed protein product [Lactuca virosa]